MRATADMLMLSVEADDEDTLWQLQNGIAGRIEKTGRRDRLRVTWRPLQAPEDAPGEAAVTAHVPDAGAGKRRGLGKAAGLGAVVLVAVALHLGLGGAVPAASPWTSWGVNAILVIVLVKLLFVGGHVILGRAGIRAVHRRRQQGVVRRPDAQDVLGDRTR
ncbi:DUF2218 domain-containing protein [Streptomyces shenzhenensis]|uniref:DUF2218 domain-containing protein n=1 Tax=Streptomyces shenzhenensis TaxID=943815 RepID=UPI001F22058E|nr:DUF2218 domain-containing protein [Streptomyces shenzhenensis]